MTELDLTDRPYPEDRWSQIPGTDGVYFVSDTGLVWAAYRPRGQYGCKRALKAGLISQNGINGYRYANLRANGKPVSTLVHRLVASAFLPNPENKPEVNHIDGNKENNNAANLEWVTRDEHWAITLSMKQVNKLTENDVHTIRNRAEKGESAKSIAASYGVHPHTVSAILNGKRWKHVPHINTLRKA